jgi:hypothetical protein
MNASIGSNTIVPKESRLLPTGKTYPASAGYFFDLTTYKDVLLSDIEIREAPWAFDL